MAINYIFKSRDRDQGDLIIFILNIIIFIIIKSINIKNSIICVINIIILL